MKKEYLRTILIMILSVCIVSFYSCKDTNTEKLSGETQLKSFGPSGVVHGEDISFIGTGLDKVTSIVMPVGVEVPRSDFKSQTSGMIVLTVPIETTVGKVMLKTPQGDIESKTLFGPSVTIAISSMTAEAKPGTNITITGEFLNFVKQVWFKKNIVVTEFVSQSRTELVVKVPLDAQTEKITLSDGAKTKPQLVESTEKLIVTLPVVSSLSPSSIKHSDNLTITGTDLDLVKQIVFEGNKTVYSFVSQSATSIVVAVPVGALNGKLTLKQISPVDVKTSMDLTIILPVANSLTPNPATPGTSDIIIAGTNLDLVGELTLSGVTSPILASQFKSQSATQIVLALPASATAGNVGYKTIQGYSNTFTVKVVLPGPGPAPITYYLYNDGLSNGWQEWTAAGPNKPDLANTEQVFNGTKALKVLYSGWTSWGGGCTAPAGTYTEFTLWVYGGPGTDGTKVNLIVNPGTWDNRHVINVAAGKWTEVTFPMATFNDNNGVVNPATWTDIRLQGQNITGTIWFDYIGFR